VWVEKPIDILAAAIDIVDDTLRGFIKWRVIMKLGNSAVLAASTMLATVLSTGASWAGTVGLESSSVTGIIAGILGSIFGTPLPSPSPHSGVRAAPGPEMSAGLLGMMLVAGVLYLILRRSRQHNAV
jgi:hypothetical protein